MRSILLTLLSTLPLGAALAADAKPASREERALVIAEAVGQASSELKAIITLDDAKRGPQLNAVIAYNPQAPREAAQLALTSLLKGRTVLIKDNVETKEWATTAGSLALKDNITGRDAPLVARIREAGGVILGKTNLSEWANIRSGGSSSGWSAVGGQTRNPHAIDRNPCGSSSGSGAAIAAGMAWAAVGTETDGSITCPASVNGIVGFKPTVGLVSRTHVVPISHSQDTAGPMARNVADAAKLLGAMAGSDPKDPATAEADRHKRDFTRDLASSSLKGVRIGVLRQQVGQLPGLKTVFDRALVDLERAGAVIVPIDYEFPDELGRDEFTVLLFELREGLGAYLSSLPGNPPVRTLADVIAFNRANASTELRWFGQETFELADQTVDRPAYEKARENSLRLAGAEGIDRLLRDNKVSVLIAPTTGPAWPTDPVTGDHFVDVGAGTLAAVAGYPHLSVPMGDVEGLPVGLSVMGAKWDDKAVLDIGAAYERARTAKLKPPRFARWGD